MQLNVVLVNMSVAQSKRNDSKKGVAFCQRAVWPKLRQIVSICARMLVLFILTLLAADVVQGTDPNVYNVTKT